METASLDSSIVYGSDDIRAKNLRANDGTGRLIADYTRQGELLPGGKLPSDGFCPEFHDSICFKAGDSRVNQHTTLSIFHMLFMREHNRLAFSLKKLNPHWEEERLYQEARRINIAQRQCEIYKEYLPVLLGPYNMNRFDLTLKNGPEGSKYNPTLRLGTWSEFTIAVYRLHSMVAKKIGFTSREFKNLYANPTLIRTGQTNNLLIGVSQVPSASYDHYYADDLTNYLYKKPGVPYGSDLCAIDMQRGRDHGLPAYVYLVSFCSGGQINITSFDDIPPFVMSPENVDLLRQNYKDVRDVDLWVGVQMEKHVPGAEISPTAACIIGKQFHLAKFADRYFFEHVGEAPSFTPAQRNALKECSVSYLLCANTGITHIQRNAMLLPSSQNPIVSCSEIPYIDLNHWREIPQK
ncbi:peroxidase [Caerostris darwini]|uniref:Peroxidase n=1 Tax=Caerostris darwini TaxID=1538125 RepID=A0AAV4V063_9ARAC|nr:peroxidase [Caerostris darwini]